MGIYDRDYIRHRQPPRGPRAMASAVTMWSVTTWLIVICVAFFVIDHVLVPRSMWRLEPVSETLPADVTVDDVHSNPARYSATLKSSTGQIVVFDVQDVVTGQDIGQVTFSLMPPLTRWLFFSSALSFLHPLQSFQFWRFIGFQFLHFSWAHLLLNMIALFFFGPLVEQALGRKRYLAFYLLCGICGALMYLLLNLGGFVVARVFSGPAFIPGLLFNSPYTPLLGASAGVFGVLMAGAYLAPREIVWLFFFLPMQLRTLAYALVVLALVNLIMGGANAGGEAGHLGGAIAGFYFIRNPRHLHEFFDVLGRVDPTSHHYRRGRPSRHEVDRILAKISATGIHGLTEREKRILEEESKGK